MLGAVRQQRMAKKQRHEAETGYQRGVADAPNAGGICFLLGWARGCSKAGCTLDESGPAVVQPAKPHATQGCDIPDEGSGLSAYEIYAGAKTPD